MNPVPDKSVDTAELRMREDAAKELVIRCSLNLAAHSFAEPAEDPGWDAEYQEDQLRDAVVTYATAIEARRAAGA